MEVEAIGGDGCVLAYVMRDTGAETDTTFVTPDDALQQVGFHVHSAGTELSRHYHLPVERQIVGTPEVLVVRSGRCEIDIYDDDQQLACTRELKTGDVMIVVGGGHGFRMIEDTVLLEVKQGPYFGPEEKTTF